MRKQRAIGPTRARLRALGAKLLDLVGQERWGLPIVFIAVVVGFPPAVCGCPLGWGDNDAAWMVRTHRLCRQAGALSASGNRIPRTPPVVHLSFDAGGPVSVCRL